MTSDTFDRGIGGFFDVGISDNYFVLFNHTSVVLLDANTHGFQIATVDLSGYPDGARNLFIESVIRDPYGRVWVRIGYIVGTIYYNELHLLNMATSALSDPIVIITRTYGFKVNDYANDLVFNNDKLYFPGDGNVYLGSLDDHLGFANLTTVVDAPPTFALPITADSGRRTTCHVKVSKSIKNYFSTLVHILPAPLNGVHLGPFQFDSKGRLYIWNSLGLIRRWTGAVWQSLQLAFDKGKCLW